MKVGLQEQRYKWMLLGIVFVAVCPSYMVSGVTICILTANLIKQTIREISVEMKAIKSVEKYNPKRKSPVFTLLGLEVFICSVVLLEAALLGLACGFGSCSVTKKPRLFGFFVLSDMLLVAMVLAALTFGFSCYQLQTGPWKQINAKLK